MLIGSADSAGYVDDAAASLAQGSVYVSPEVGDATALADSLAAQIGDASVGVAVFSDNAALEASGPDIVNELAQRTDYDTIIVAVGDDLSAGSSVLPAGEAMRIANEAESAAGSVPAALTETVQTVVADSAPPPVTTDAGGGLLVGLALAAAAVAAVATGAIAAARSRRRRTRANRPLPDDIGALIGSLRSVRGEYAAAGARGVAIAGRTAQDIDALTGNVEQLFLRLAEKGLEDQRSLAEVEYGDKLRKLSVALDRGYLLDLLTHPNLWDDPDERVGEVRDALTAVSEQVVDNTKQVNARRALHFQVSLDSLTGRRSELNDWDRDFRRADDGTPPAP